MNLSTRIQTSSPSIVGFKSIISPHPSPHIILIIPEYNSIAIKLLGQLGTFHVPCRFALIMLALAHPTGESQYHCDSQRNSRAFARVPIGIIPTSPCTIRADRKRERNALRHVVLGISGSIRRRPSAPSVLAQFGPVLWPCRSTPE